MASNLKLALREFCVTMPKYLSESVTFRDTILPSYALAFIPLPRLAFGYSEISFCLFEWVQVSQGQKLLHMTASASLLHISQASLRAPENYSVILKETVNNRKRNYAGVNGKGKET